MADRKDDFTNRRQFRQALSTLGAKHPRLLTANKVQRMDNDLEELTAEEPLKRPRGRPPKSGTNYLGEQTRFSVRIPTTLFDRFIAYAERRGYVRGEVKLAKYIREALEHFLSCPHKRQTQIKDSEPLIYICPTENNQKAAPPPPSGSGESSAASAPDPAPKPATLSDLDPATVPSAFPDPETETAAQDCPPFDTVKFRLGKLCKRGHEWGRTGQTRYKNNIAGHCPACLTANKREARARQRQLPAPQDPDPGA